MLSGIPSVGPLAPVKKKKNAAGAELPPTWPSPTPGTCTPPARRSPRRRRRRGPCWPRRSATAGPDRRRARSPHRTGSPPRGTPAPTPPRPTSSRPKIGCRSARCRCEPPAAACGPASRTCHERNTARRIPDPRSPLSRAAVRPPRRETRAWGSGRGPRPGLGGLGPDLPYVACTHARTHAPTTTPSAPADPSGSAPFTRADDRAKDLRHPTRTPTTPPLPDQSGP